MLDNKLKGKLMKIFNGELLDQENKNTIIDINHNKFRLINQIPFDLYDKNRYKEIVKHIWRDLIIILYQINTKEGYIDRYQIDVRDSNYKLLKTYTKFINEVNQEVELIPSNLTSPFLVISNDNRCYFSYKGQDNHFWILELQSFWTSIEVIDKIQTINSLVLDNIQLPFTYKLSVNITNSNQLIISWITGRSFKYTFIDVLNQEASFKVHEITTFANPYMGATGSIQWDGICRPTNFESSLRTNKDNTITIQFLITADRSSNLDNNKDIWDNQSGAIYFLEKWERNVTTENNQEVINWTLLKSYSQVLYASNNFVWNGVPFIKREHYTGFFYGVKVLNGTFYFTIIDLYTDKLSYDSKTWFIKVGVGDEEWTQPISKVQVIYEGDFFKTGVKFNWKDTQLHYNSVYDYNENSKLWSLTYIFIVNTQIKAIGLFYKNELLTYFNKINYFDTSNMNITFYIDSFTLRQQNLLTHYLLTHHYDSTIDQYYLQIISFSWSYNNQSPNELPYQFAPMNNFLYDFHLQNIKAVNKYNNVIFDGQITHTPISQNLLVASSTMESFSCNDVQIQELKIISSSNNEIFSLNYKEPPKNRYEKKILNIQHEINIRDITNNKDVLKISASNDLIKLFVLSLNDETWVLNNYISFIKILNENGYEKIVDAKPYLRRDGDVIYFEISLVNNQEKFNKFNIILLNKNQNELMNKTIMIPIYGLINLSIKIYIKEVINV